MAKKIPESDNQSLQHFLSNSLWDERPVIDQAANDAGKLFSNHLDTAFYIDETGFAKKGDKSVGVRRQWIGSWVRLTTASAAFLLLWVVETV